MLVSCPRIILKFHPPNSYDYRGTQGPQKRPTVPELFLNFKHFNVGLIAKEECAKTECTSSQESDPDGNNCYINDGYLRTMLYRAWLPSCPILDLYNTNEKWYVLDHHGTWRYGESAVIRCFPGFQLNNVTQVKGYHNSRK